MDIGTKLPPISIKAEPLFDINLGPVHFAFTNSMLFGLIVMIALVLFFGLATRRMSVVPRGAQNFAEALVEFLLGTAEGTAGRRVGRRILPLTATIFLFIIVANWSSLLPGVGTIGYCGEEHVAAAAGTAGASTTVGAEAPATSATEKKSGLPAPKCPEGKVFIPFLRAANADLNMTLAMALIAFLVIEASGIIAHGPGGYLKELMTPIFLTPIHIIGEFSRIISLSFRLFGNVFGGEVLVTVMYVLLGSVFLGFGTFIFLGLELLFGFIQATLFSVLTLVFVATAVSGHGAGEGHGDVPHPEPGSMEELGVKVSHALAGGSTPTGGGSTGSTAGRSGG